ncbi:uncharacterized protein LOC122377536 [Amphibalanus amphitrite]|uniref:uncharacterized protein LOC122377536 n=1 Tax=Amphibalanus amphitrite TaxID=1232801 RepID=UPI001C8FAC7E|nr:uncharacterized protein LOC122377536 [Amphibalanus amphitrite]
MWGTVDRGELLQPLHALITHKAKRSRAPVTWTDSARQRFKNVKDALATATHLAHQVPDAPLALFVDASDCGVGAVLQQHVAGEWQPLAFFSKTLQPAEKKYSTFGRELLAIYLAVRHFKHAIEGRSAIIFTDHRPLVTAIGSSSDRYSPREVRHLDYIGQFVSDIRHVPGKDNVVADTLSRTVSMVAQPRPPLADFTAIAKAQSEDGSLEDLEASDTSLRLRHIPVGEGLLEGALRSEALTELSNAELLDELKEQGVIKVERLRSNNIEKMGPNPTIRLCPRKGPAAAPTPSAPNTNKRGHASAGEAATSPSTGAERPAPSDPTTNTTTTTDHTLTDTGRVTNHDTGAGLASVRADWDQRCHLTHTLHPTI